jgi:hypothetical protein
MEKFFYTDYPDRIVRKIRLLSYDRDKYCQVSFLDAFCAKDVMSIKAGYIFRDVDLKNRVKISDLISVPCSPDLPIPTRIRISNERRMMRHQHDVIYSVYHQKQDGVFGRREFNTLKNAIAFFKKVKTSAELCQCGKYTIKNLLTKEFDDGTMTVYVQCDRKNRSVIKKHHLK